MDPAVKTENVHKTFSGARERKSMFRALEASVLRKRTHSTPVRALVDITVTLLRGEKIGIVGNNGSGKTTLLKVIAGLYGLSGGNLYVNGNVSFLAGFGIGMVDELSVEENIFLYGAIYGMERDRIKRNLHEIIEWADLQNFEKSKLKTLSAGMITRLAFSAVRHIETDILLIDEALSAGDKNFRRKCQEYFERSKQNDKTFIVATHDLEFVNMFCTKTLWLHKGRQMAFGETGDVLKAYRQSTVK